MTQRRPNRLLFASFFFALLMMLGALPAFAQVQSTMCPECNPLADRANELKKPLAELRAKVNAAIAAQSAADKAQREANEKEKEATQAKYRFMSEADKKRDASKKKRDKEDEERKRKIRELTAEIAQLTKGMADQQTEHARLTASIPELQQAVETADENLKYQEEEVAKAQAKVQEAAKASTAANQLANSTVQSYERDENRTTQNRAARAARADLAAAREDLAKAQTALNSAKAKAKAAHQRLDNIGNLQSAAIAKFNQLRAEKQAKEAELARLSGIRDGGPTDFDENSYQEELSQYEAREREARAATDAANKALDAAMKAVGDALNEEGDAQKLYNDAVRAWEQCMDDCRSGKKKKVKEPITEGGGGTGVTTGTGGGTTSGGTGATGGTTGGGRTATGGGTAGGQTQAPRAKCQPCIDNAQAVKDANDKVAAVEAAIKELETTYNAEKAAIDERRADAQREADEAQKAYQEYINIVFNVANSGVPTDPQTARAHAEDLKKDISAARDKLKSIKAENDALIAKYNSDHQKLVADKNAAIAERDAAQRALKNCEKKCGTVQDSQVMVVPGSGGANVEVEEVHLVTGTNPLDPRAVEDTFNRGAAPIISSGGGSSGPVIPADPHQPFVSSGSISVVHVVGSTACPTPFSNVVVRTTAGDNVTISGVSTSGSGTSRIISSPSGSGGTAPQFESFFNCSSPTPGTYSITVNFTATVGATPTPLSFTATVTVQ